LLVEFEFGRFESNETQMLGSSFTLRVQAWGMSEQTPTIGGKMPREKDQVLRKSVDVLVAKAHVAAGLANEQRMIADKEHDMANEHSEAARHLELLSVDLAKGAKDVKEKMDALPTVTLGCRASMWRMGQAISAGDRAAVAT
jgi:hypothetical protein